MTLDEGSVNLLDAITMSYRGEDSMIHRTLFSAPTNYLQVSSGSKLFLLKRCYCIVLFRRHNAEYAVTYFGSNPWPVEDWLHRRRVSRRK